MENTGKLSSKTVLSYGMGEFGFNFINYLIAYYLLFFMTNVLLLPISTAAVIYSVIQFFEAGTGLLCGILVDRSKLKGKYTTWALRGAIICAIFGTLVFTNFPVSTLAKEIIFIISYFLCYLGFNFMWVSYRALVGVVGKTSEQTVKLSVTASQLGTIGMFLFSYVGVKLLNIQNQTLAFFLSAAIYGVILIISFVIVRAGSRQADLEHSEETTVQKKLEAKDILKTFNAPTVLFSVASILRFAAQTVLGSLLVYYFSLVMKSSNMMTIYLLENSILTFLSGFVVTAAVKKMSKLTLYYSSTLTSLVFMAIAYFIGKTPVTFLVFMGFYIFFNAMGGQLLMPFFADLADYNEYERGLDTRAFTYSISSGCIYLSQAVGAAIASFGLSTIGYDATLPVQPQSFVDGVGVVMLVGSIVVTLISLLPMLFYKLNAKTMEGVYAKKAAATAKAEE